MLHKAIAALTLGIFCLLTASPQADAQKAVESFFIRYNHAGLRAIEVKDGQLHHVWHSLRQFGDGEPMVMRQDLSSYDRYEAHIWLTQQELKRFYDWITEYKIFRFEPTYASVSEGRSYAAAFKTSLAVIQGNKSYTISWVGDSQIPDRLQKTVNYLIGICEEVQRTHEGK
jgi:hypothetical protein